MNPNSFNHYSVSVFLSPNNLEFRVKESSVYDDVSVTLWSGEKAPNGVESFLQSEVENYSKAFVPNRDAVMDYNLMLAIETEEGVYDLIGEEEITEENIRSILK